MLRITQYADRLIDDAASTENVNRQDAPETCGPVHRDGTYRIVDTQLVEGDDGEHHDDAADGADQGGGGRAQEQIQHPHRQGPHEVHPDALGLEEGSFAPEDLFGEPLGDDPETGKPIYVTFDADGFVPREIVLDGAAAAAARVEAFLEGRDYAIPEDVKAIFPSLSRHRMSVPHGMETSVTEQISGLLNQVAIP